MSYRHRFLSVFIVVVLFFVLTVCNANAAATLKFADQNSETGWGSVHGVQPWIKKVEKESDGKLKIQLYPNQTLSKGNQTWSATRKGIADMSWNAMAVNSGLNPLAEVITLPGLPYDDPVVASARLWEGYEKFPSLAKLYDANKVLGLFTSDKFNLVTSKPIRKLEDLKGKKIRTIAGPLADALESLGAIPVVIPMPDVYLAMQRGTIDGTLSSWESFNGFRFYEVGKHVITNVPFGFSFFVVAMNKDAYDKLSDEEKAVIDANSGLEGSKWWAEHFSKSSRQVPQILKEKGIELDTYELDPQERARWVDKVSGPVAKKWEDTVKGKGFQEAGEILEFFQNPEK